TRTATKCWRMNAATCGSGYVTVSITTRGAEGGAALKSSRSAFPSLRARSRATSSEACQGTLSDCTTILCFLPKGWRLAWDDTVTELATDDTRRGSAGVWGVLPRPRGTRVGTLATAAAPRRPPGSSRQG